jgi:hypothetical protein
MATNFQLAPPAKVVDGLLAVPIDIQSTSATLVFDGAAATAQADATVDFIAGPADGNPIFDLRQAISDAWLDGTPVPIGQLAHHDFGGGPDAQLRVIQSVVLAGTAHTLRVRYALGPPQASAAGSYQPALAWTAGPRLAFNFGFTDLGAGRYLEAWLPANLTFDQFSLALDVAVANTAIAHSVITNAAVTVIGANHWQLAWPATITALSPLLEIRATDTLQQLSGPVTLPVSGASVTIETWKLAAGAASLPAQLANLQAFLADNESAVGTYLHGNRFVAFLNTGGMEYEGGTTSGTGALRHETFHSWWGRGVKPALGRDGWFDEAWTAYTVDGGGGSVPIDFTDSPATLAPLNPWSRVTPLDAYTRGREMFQGLAALLGTSALSQSLDQFYAAQPGSPVTTEQVEEWLLARGGDDDVVDAFHRFVYGFADPAGTPDIWLKDDPGHAGAEAWAGAFWDSPDLWVRTADDGGSAHQNPEHGQDNWLHARIRNRGSQAVRHFAVSFNVKSFAGVQFSYPGDFLPGVAAVVGFDLAPGEARVVKQRWPKAAVPPGGTHACLLAAAICRGDHPVAGAHVWERNNLAQKNLTIVDLEPGDWFVLPFVVNRVPRRGWPWFHLTIARPRELPHLAVEVLDSAPTTRLGWMSRAAVRAEQSPREQVQPRHAEALDCGAEASHDRLNYLPWTSKNPASALAERMQAASTFEVPAGILRDVAVTGSHAGPLRLGLRIHVPKGAAPGSRFKVHAMQRSPFLRRTLGGVAVEVRVQDKSKNRPMQSSGSTS